ncbi:MAG TPA: acyltransferase family protein, partial [Sphingomonas sp.]|nr:acyltransferase family protein [Sphingomonas sp.]
MPFFFLLSGVLVQARIERDAPGFGRSLFTRIAWPYFLWSTVQLVIIHLLGTLANRPVEDVVHPILSLPWQTVSQFWFLYALFVLHGLALLTLRPLGASGFLALCIAFKVACVLLPVPEALRAAGNQAPYYALGVALGAEGLRRIAAASPAWLTLPLVCAAAAAALGAALFLTIAAHPDMLRASAGKVTSLAWRPAMIPVALLCVLAAAMLAAIAAGRLKDGLVLLGRRAMAIYILHIMAIAGLRIVAMKLFGIGNAWALLPVLVMAGIVAPLIAYAVAKRLGLARALTLD